MLSLNSESIAGQACVRLENDSLCLWATTSIGPRILGLTLYGEESLFAVLPDVTLDCPGVGVYHFYGCHRLWAAPENPPRTYLPDNHTTDIQEIEDGICLTQPVEQLTHIQKRIIIRLPDQGT